MKATIISETTEIVARGAEIKRLKESKATKKNEKTEIVVGCAEISCHPNVIRKMINE